MPAEDSPEGPVAFRLRASRRRRGGQDRQRAHRGERPSRTISPAAGFEVRAGLRGFERQAAMRANGTRSERRRAPSSARADDAGDLAGERYGGVPLPHICHTAGTVHAVPAKYSEEEQQKLTNQTRHRLDRLARMVKTLRFLRPCVSAPLIWEEQMASIAEVEGIGPAYAEKLKENGIKTTEALLEAGATAKGRQALAAVTGISEKLILSWANKADLFRIKGVGEQYTDLLEAAGVDTVAELSKRRADNLTLKMTEVNEEKKLVRKLPTEAQVSGWIEAAKALPRVMTY